jgi:hypothetical protein
MLPPLRIKPTRLPASRARSCINADSAAAPAPSASRLDEAQRFGERGVELLSGHLGFRGKVLQLLGDIATHPERFDAERGEAHYRQALALAEPRRMRPLIAHCHLGLSRLYQRTGKREQAREYLTVATTMYREMDMHFYLEQAKAEARELT